MDPVMFGAGCLLVLCACLLILIVIGGNNS
jgi:hypothetical protein